MSIYMILQTTHATTAIKMRSVRQCYDAPTIRHTLEHYYQGFTVYTPLDRFPVGGMVVVVYGSDDPSGYGRKGGQFQEWVIAPSLAQ
jgi:hypothetical protein